MSKKQKIISLSVFFAVIAALTAGILLTGSPGEKESIQTVMQDAVLHEDERIDLFGMSVNPGLLSAFVVTGMVAVFAVSVRIFVIPRFKEKPGPFQLLLETLVGFFDSLAKTNSPHKNQVLGGYVFTAGFYIFFSTIFELFGIQAVTAAGHSISLPAPLSDINGACGMGIMTYGFILMSGLFTNGLRGAGGALKDFSLPISMSFRLFGALLSGALVTELVYHYLSLSFVLPVFVGVLFTLLHAVIQTYVLCMLTTVFYGEVTEPPKNKKKKNKIQKNKRSTLS